MLAVCDAYEAMTSDRAYRPAMRPEAAAEELHALCRDRVRPAVVEALLSAVDQGPEAALAGSTGSKT